MNKAWKSIVLVIIIFSISVLIPSFIDSIDLFGSKAEAEDATWSETDSGIVAGSNNTPDRFLIVEITPYKGMSEIGYLIGGQEPINEELFDKDHATGDLSFLGGAITPYHSYVEKELPASGTADAGWTRARAYTTQNGYFQYVGTTGGNYKLTAQEVYTRVADGEGNYIAKLNKENTAIYNNTYNTLNEKNVNAYFVYQKPDGVSLYSKTNRYEVCSVTRTAEGNGDYDYNSETQTFHLNKGQGTYDVIFESDNKGEYYMLADYQVVEDGSGNYSWSLSYDNVGTNNGNYIKEANGIRAEYKAGDPYNYRYVWVPSESALDKPTNFYQEGVHGTTSEKIWVKGQKLEKYYEYNFNITLVNNEWFKRLTLGIAAEKCEAYQVEVKTLTPAEANRPENQEYLQKANMFYINDNYEHNSSYISLYETKSYEGLELETSQRFSSIKSKLNFGDNDLSWDSVMNIFNRVIGLKNTETGQLGGYRAAILFDDTFYQDAVAMANEYNINLPYSKYWKKVSVSFTWNNNGASVCNMAKLYIMLYQRDPVEFYKLFLSPTSTNQITKYESTEYVSGSTGYFIRPDSTVQGNASQAKIEATYWNGNTFCPFVSDDSGNLIKIDRYWQNMTLLEQEIPNYNITAATTDMIANVLVLNGQDIFTDEFVQNLYGMPSDALEAARTYASSLDDEEATYWVKLCSYVNLITNSGKGYGNSSIDDASIGENGTGGSNLRTYTCVLNIEPTADFTESENYIRTMLKGYQVKVVNMTSVQFNSSILDINTHFDMIYIGDSGGRFNTDHGTTVFNKAENQLGVIDDGLNGSVYNKGDRILTADGIQNLSGNDLTMQKISELTEFLKAGYPIVLDYELYYLLSEVHSSTNLYDFIYNTRVNTHYNKNFLNTLQYDGYLYGFGLNSYYKIDFMDKLASALHIVRPMLRIAQPTLDAASKEDYVYVDPDTNKFNIEFSIVPRELIADDTLKYNAYLYIDYNEDGLFTENERLNPIPDGSSMAYGITESKLKSYKYSYDMKDYNGVYQWQVKVVRQSTDSDGKTLDTAIRSEITGYVACSNRRTINILQITDNATDPSVYPIEEKVNDSSSLIRQYGGFGETKLKDYDLDFDTMSVEEFLHQYEVEPYTAENAATSDKLSEYHVLLLDNQVDQITDEDGALLNIRNSIDNGIGILFTKGSINYSNQNTYLESDNLLFEDQKTYSKISFRETPTEDYDYDDYYYDHDYDKHWRYWLNGYYHYIYQELFNSDPYYIFDFDISNFATALNNEVTYHTTYATKSNEGTDCEYPYKIGAAIKIAETSYTEDATIDLDKTDSVPLIGWYSLADARSPEVRAAGLVSDTAANLYTGIYSSSPNDVKNNYYLFKRGKIYYSGIQLKDMTDKAGNDDEIKLFINTLITAYKTSKRAASVAPAIQITKPKPDNNIITLSPSDVGDKTVIPFTFEITKSSSNMELSFLWNDTAVTEAWTVNKVSSTGGGMEAITDFTNITKGTYVVTIPTTQLEGTNKLTIRALNKEGRSTKLDTTILYYPIIITIDNTDLVKNVDKGEQYLYIDIDYAEVGNEASYLGAAGDIKLEFTVDNTSDQFSVLVKDAEGNNVAVTGNKIYPANVDEATATTYSLNEKTVTKGSYYLYLPASIMNGISRKDITITAMVDSANSTATTVTLLRRSLFQLE